MEEVTYQIEHRAIEHGVSLLDGLQAQCLHEVALAQTRWTEPEYILGLTNEAACRQVEDLLPRQAGVERPVEVIERLVIAELSTLDAAFDLSITTQEHFILHGQFQELGMAELVRLGFLQPNLQTLGHARELELP